MFVSEVMVNRSLDLCLIAKEITRGCEHQFVFKHAYNSKQGGEHGYSITRVDNFVLIIIIEDNYSKLIQYEILKKLVTFIVK